MLYAFFWLILWRLNFIFRRFGTLCSIFIGGLVSRMTSLENVGVFIREKVPVLTLSSSFLLAQTIFEPNLYRINTPTFSNCKHNPCYSSRCLLLNPATRLTQELLYRPRDVDLRLRKSTSLG